MKEISIKQSLWQMAILAFLLSSFSSQEVQAQCSGVSESDSLELVALYNATNGDSWGNNSGWLVAPVKEWKGITLTFDGCYVEEIDLKSQGLAGVLIDLQLPHLKEFNLLNNYLSGNIPDFSNLPKLTILNFAGNGFSGEVPDFSNLPNLTSLGLFRNDLSGSIPDFSNLTNLEMLWLRENDLSGSIPDFSNLPNLEILSLGENGLSGSIPDFSNLPKLEILRLGENDLSGAIPDFSNLPNLITLSLIRNILSGGIPDFSNLPNLDQLFLYENNLSGSIPDFSNFPKLTELYLYENDLSGNIPNFSNLPSVKGLSLSNNTLSGTIPDFNNFPNLKQLSLSDNTLSGSIPDFSTLPSLTGFYCGNNNLSGTIPDFSNVPTLFEFYCGNNNLSGSIPNFSNLPELSELIVCPNNLQGGIPNFKLCPFLESEYLDFSCVKSAQVSGYVFYDENANCIKDENEKGLPDVFVYTDDGQFITTTDENGFYVLRTDIGSYTFSSFSINSSIWSQNCPEPSTPYTAIFSTYADSIGNLNYAYEPKVDCSQMKVEIGSSGLTRCFDNLYTVNYCNIGTAIAENAYIELYFPDEILALSSSIPYLQTDDRLIFNLGDVDLFECGSFTVTDSVSCEAVLGSTACVEAYAYPNDACELSSFWSGANLKVKGECLGDSIQFTIQNRGADMIRPTSYNVYEDDILVDFDSFQLDRGGSIVLSYKATGAAFRLTVRQSRGNPGQTAVTKVIEGCGNAPFSFGFVNSQWDGDDSSFFDSDCQEIVGSYDPNDKMVFPAGVLEGNHIPDSIDLTYRIRFQNTGNSLAYQVVIVDTIDTEHLQLPSLELGAYSHDFDLTIENGNILIFAFKNILLPDSTSNEPASHGFVTYTLKQKTGNVIGDLITNEAGIYFDYNAPVITNKVFNTVGIPDIEDMPLPPIIHEDDLAAIVDYNNQQMSIQINEVQAEEQFSIQLFNVLGQEMFVIPNLSLPLHQEALPQVHAGVYIYNIQSSEGRVARGKVLVR